MNEVIATPFSFSQSRHIDKNVANMKLFSYENATSNYPYNLPSYLTFLVIKHYEVPTTTCFDLEIIELDNFDLALGDEEIQESEELIITQKEHDANFLKPFNIKTEKKQRIIFK